MSVLDKSFFWPVRQKNAQQRTAPTPTIFITELATIIMRVRLLPLGIVIGYETKKMNLNSPPPGDAARFYLVVAAS